MSAVVAMLVCTSAAACNVPVFRYALEHWNPDSYRGVVFHRGPLSESEQAQIAAFTAHNPGSPVNLTFRHVDLNAAPSPADAALAASLNGAEFPQLIVQYPARHQQDSVLWSGPLDGDGLKQLADSPARQEILTRLIAGQTAVWLIIESGETALDEAALKTLEAELKNLPRTLKLPVQTDAPEDAIGDGPELRVEFSVLKISRSDPREVGLMSMLIHSEPDLGELKEPLVFPVFGRCRSLLPLVGAGISPENIRGTARFLAGACSCQVKEQNPGFDLLVTADWNELIPWAKSPLSAALAKTATGQPELVPIASGARPVESSTVAVVANETGLSAAPKIPPQSPPATTAPAAPRSSAPMVAPRPTGPFARLPLTGVLLVVGVVFFAALLIRR